MAARQRSFEAVLNQIVGAVAVTHQRPRVASQIRHAMRQLLDKIVQQSIQNYRRDSLDDARSNFLNKSGRHPCASAARSADQTSHKLDAPI